MPTLAPRRAAIPQAPTTGRAAALESRLLKTYRAGLATLRRYAEWEQLCAGVFGPPQTRYGQPLSEKAAAACVGNQVERLQEVVPELLMLLSAEEQEALAPELLEHHNLAAFAKAVVQANGAGNRLYTRETESGLDDAYLLKAAGMGRLSRADGRAGWVASQKARGLPTGGPALVLTPVIAQPIPARRRRATSPASRNWAAGNQLQLWLFPVGASQGAGL